VAERAHGPAVHTDPTTDPRVAASQPLEARSISMEMEYKDTNRRGKFVIIVGVVLAVVAGATSFYLINQAQQTANNGPATLVEVVVAAAAIPARTPIQPGAVVIRKIPLDTATQVGIISDPLELEGKVLAIPLAIGQPIYRNMILSASGQSGFSILGPDETVGPDSEAWRAISIAIPDDRAVAGLLVPGQTIDIFMTATMTVPLTAEPVGVFYSDMVTKITYQDMVILARAGSQYILKTSLPVAEEILHMLATGTVAFSAALRPDEDVRYADVTKLGATTNRILEKYGLPFPAIYPGPSASIKPQPPIVFPTIPPTPAPATPEPSPGASTAP
jgi:Flp pilus assembly protein CpaB